MAIITGTTGNDTLTGTSGDDQIAGLGGNDNISAGDGNDEINGGTGNDNINGGNGNDIYHFDHGDGQDIINDTGGYDTLRFATTVDLPNIAIHRNVSGHLVITLDTGDTITSTNHFTSASYGIDQISFDGGAFLDLTTYQYETRGTNGNDLIYGISYNGSKDDIIYGYDGNDNLQGLDGNDYLYGGIGNDTLYGGTGNDTYHYDVNGGIDTFEETAVNSGNDTIHFGAGIDLSDLSFVRDKNDNLIINIDTNNQITVRQYFRQGQAIENLLFDDTSTVDLTTKQYETHGTASADTIYGTSYNGLKNDIIYGYDGNDNLQGLDGNDYLDGGVGNDTLYGGAGNDTYYFGIDSGIDTAIEFYAPLDNDTIKLGAGIDLSDLTLIRDKNDNLIITLDANNQITVSGHFQQGKAVENLLFDDASTLDLLTKQYETHGTASADTIYGISYNGSKNDIIYGHEGNDNLQGLDGNDYLDGGTGNDILYGGAGNDTYYFGADSGIDTAVEFYAPTDNDTIALGAGINLSDLTFIRDKNDDLIISLDANNQVTITDHFQQGKAVENLLFEDASSTNLTTYQYETHGTSSGETLNGIQYNGSMHDIMYGFDGNDTLNGLAGNDILYGGNGNDSLLGGNDNDILYGGDGLDTLNGGTGADIFVFEAASAFNNIDVIQDFNRSQGDKLDISDLLIGYTSGISDINDFVSLSTTSGNTTVLIDRDGTGSSYNDQSITVLNSSSGFSVDDLFNNNHLIV